MSTIIHMKRALTRASSAIVGVGIALALAGCAAAPNVTPSAPAADSLLADYGLAGLAARDVIEQLDTMPMTERPGDLIASVRPDHLVISDDRQRETELPMPTDEFYLSVAPYLTQTHDCYYHSLTTCTGELQNADVTVTVTDDATGAVIVQEDLRTYDNGFLGLWLPRDIDATLTVEYDGLSAMSPITTSGDEAATCLTTLPLS